MIKPFSINVDNAVLKDLDYRLSHTRWPDQVGSAWLYGTDSHYLKTLVEYWQHDFNWKEQEDQLNQLDQFMTSIQGKNLHFIHQRSSHDDAIPLLMTHGWPGSVSEFTKIIPMLTQPERFGGDSSDAFHLICPSLAGYGFSEAPTTEGFDQQQVALQHIELMQQLGYPQYVVQGGDWGSAVSSWTARLAPQAVKAMHLTLIFAPYPSVKADPFAGVTDKEKKHLANSRSRMKEGTGYQAIQSTKPQTLGFSLNDSPVGLAAWITEKFRHWMDCDGHIESVISKDELLTNIMIYWVSQSITSSMRLYYESSHTKSDLFANGRIETPTGHALFPGELYLPPRVWANELYNIQHWTEQPRGGHFAALEQPELLAEDLRLFFRKYR